MRSVEVVRSFVRRATNVNPALNALTKERFHAALLEARRVDFTLDQGYSNGSLTPQWVKEHKPLLGVPFTVKETIAVAGMPHTGGLVARVGSVAAHDARVVTNLKEAGAILLATTNVSELGLWWECHNKVYGRTNNPYDSRRTPGGSSGGEAALLCACATPLSVGTDTGGSIRTPAFFCGLFGHKPTAGVVSVEGCNVHGEEAWSEVQCAGPLARHARDLPLVLAVLAGERVSRLTLGTKVDPGRVDIFTLEGADDGVLSSSVSQVLIGAQRAVTTHFQHTYDCTVQKVRIPDMARAFQIWQEKMEEEYPDANPVFTQLADNKGEINVYTEMTRSALGRGRHTAPLLAQAFLHKLRVEVAFLRDQTRVLLGRDVSPSPTTTTTAATTTTPARQKHWKSLQMKLQRLLGDSGVLVYPSHPTLAPYHRQPCLAPLNFAYTAIFNALGFPVTQVPLGLAPNGLPLGVQLVGGRNQDHLTMALAQDLEKAFGGWVCPSKIL